MKKIMGLLVSSGTTETTRVKLDLFYPNDIEHIQGRIGGPFEHLTSAVHEATFLYDLGGGHRPFNQFATLLARMNVEHRRDICMHGTVLMTGPLDQSGLPTSAPETLLNIAFGMYRWRFQTQDTDGEWIEHDEVFDFYLGALAAAIDTINGADRMVPVRVVRA